MDLFIVIIGCLSGLVASIWAVSSVLKKAINGAGSMLLSRQLQQLGYDPQTAKMLSQGAQTLNKPYQQNPDVGAGAVQSGIKSFAKTAVGVTAAVVAPGLIGTELAGKAVVKTTKLAGKGASAVGKRLLASKPVQLLKAKTYTPAKEKLSDYASNVKGQLSDYTSKVRMYENDKFADNGTKISQLKANKEYLEGKLAQTSDYWEREKLLDELKDTNQQINQRRIARAITPVNTIKNGVQVVGAVGTKAKDKVGKAAVAVGGAALVAGAVIGNQVTNTVGYKIGASGMRQLKSTATPDALLGPFNGHVSNRQGAAYATAMMMNAGIPLGVGAMGGMPSAIININDFSTQKTYTVNPQGSVKVANFSELAPIIKQYSLNGKEAKKVVDINRKDDEDGLDGSDYYQQAIIEAVRQTKGNMSTTVTRSIANQAELFKRENEAKKRQEMINGVDNSFNMNSKKREAIEDVLRNSSGETAKSIEKYKRENLGISELSDEQKKKIEEQARANVERDEELTQEEREQKIKEETSKRIEEIKKQDDAYATETMIEGIMDDPELAKDILGKNGSKDYEEKMKKLSEEREKEIRKQRLKEKQKEYREFASRHSEYSNLGPKEMQQKINEHEIKENVQEAIRNYGSNKVEYIDLNRNGGRDSYQYGNINTLSTGA